MLMEFRRPDRCVVGTVGEPGNRLFLIQVAQGSRIAAVALEKEQAQLIGRRIAEILDQLVALGAPVPEAFEPRDLGPLDAPVEIDFRAGAIGLAWDAGQTAVQLELFPTDGFVSDEGTLVQIWLTPVQAREFAGRTEQIVASGRPACPVCAQPLGPHGHICPRANGYRRTLRA
ncbi:DUF3090 domain-containing protein [uncultured Tessaracoccus sp.]|uniref:DUF3090 domain-containing protein n=1 Tax=uncultured Tessaracoccus sp. TaxID=905023 RepID=UPI0025D6248C|nr:DUF3090 domain-containing protein [uncultured Tessaracoccus sp.]